METSTPVIPPGRKSRVSFSVTRGKQLSPLKRTPGVFGVLNESIDDVERAERRQSVALRRSVLALPSAADTASPTLNDSVRALSDEDLKSQLQTFCVLHASNKISAKNAWNLRVIDVLKQIVSKDNVDVLKVAGNSLEIAGKVYGLRVDDLHAEGLKLAGSLARNFASKNQENEENDENGDPNTDDPENGKKKKKERQKKKRDLTGGPKLTINADPKAFIGTLPKLESAAFSARTDTTLSAIGNLFTNRVRMDPVGYKFMFASKDKAWGWIPGNDPSVNMDTNKKFPVPATSVRNFKVCGQFETFRMDIWNPDDENIELLRKSVVLDDVVLDANGIPVAELDGSIPDVFQEMDNADLNDDDPVETEVVANAIHQDPERIVDFRPTAEGLEISKERSAYSFNTVIETCGGKIDQIWAGPNHWKLKFIRRSQTVYSGQDRNEQKEQDRNKKRGTKRKHEAVHVDLRNLPPPKDFTKSTKKPWRKKKNFLMDPDKLLVPILDSACIKLIENIDYLMTIPTMKPVTKKKKPHGEMDYSVSEYNYNNPNDDDYCPQQTNVNDDNGADLADDIFGNDDNGADMANSHEDDGYIGDNLVDAPQMVQQTYMHYATKAKRMDMKKLKHAVWCTLTKTDQYDPSLKVIPTLFSEMYKELAKILPEKMKMELSPALSFVALLHLCNEQNLALGRLGNISDFTIKGTS